MDRAPTARRSAAQNSARIGGKSAPAATAAGATGRRQWFAGLAATHQF